MDFNLLSNTTYSAMNVFEPNRTEPTGADKPFDRQKHIESKSRAIRATDSLRYWAALKTRAPSICNAIVLPFVIALFLQMLTNSSSHRKGRTLPPHIL